MKNEKDQIEIKSLRTPTSAYHKRVRYAVLEFEHLLDSSSIDAKGWAQIAETVFHNYRLYDGFVILHGQPLSLCVAKTYQVLQVPIVLRTRLLL
jgi:L-asparaginase/Glu-tRNA(Gln) amidotransferase subunit D